MANIAYQSEYYGVVGLGDSLYHHGIKGQKWGIRRYQNPDGTLTPAGMAHYRTDRAGSAGSSKLTRTSAKMYEKYKLLEPNPTKDQAWDNARDMVDAGAGARNVSKYLRANGLSSKQFFSTQVKGKQYVNDVKKLAKMRDRANVDLQAQKAEQYERRAQKAGKVAKIAGGIALASNLGRIPVYNARAGIHKKADMAFTIMDNEDRRLHKIGYDGLYKIATRENWAKRPDWTRNRLDQLGAAVDKGFEKSGMQYELTTADLNRKLSTLKTLNTARKVVSIGSLGTTAAAGGVYAYNKIQGKRARARTTAEGHAKAEQEFEAFREDLKKKYGRVYLRDL